MPAAIPTYEGLLYTVFQQLRHPGAGDQQQASGVAIAFSSANPGEGVTHTIQALLSGLVRDGASRTLVADSRHLRNLTHAPEQIAEHIVALPAASGTALSALMDPAQLPYAVGPHSWEGSWQYRRDVVAHLQTLFDYVLIDCPALRTSNDILALAPFVSGIILVVEAGKTRREQIVHAEKSIAFARGTLLGHILNKRTYVVPAWIHRHL